MHEIGGNEAQTHLSDLLDRAASGESITIMRHCVPVAMLVPPPARRIMSVQEVIAAIREFRKSRHAAIAEIREWLEEGRD